MHLRSDLKQYDVMIRSAKQTINDLQEGGWESERRMVLDMPYITVRSQSLGVYIVLR
jgi:hypothetical protein